MDPTSVIFILNALVNLGLDIANNYAPPPGTPEEEQKKYDEILLKLHATAAAVAAWQPLPTDTP